MTSLKEQLSKYARLGPYGLSASIIIILAVIFRTILVIFHFPEVNSDEGKMGIEGMHIAFHGAFLIYHYGQPYLGVLEAYVAAPFFRLFGASDITLRAGMILMFAAFLVIMYWLTSLLYSKRLAIVTLLLLSFATTDMLIQQLRAIGGAMELIMFAALMFLLAYRLAATAGERSRGRYLTFIAWGWTVGIALWVHILVLPFVVCSGILILVFCYREWRTRAVPCLLVGFLIGGFLLIPGYESIPHALSFQSGAAALGSASSGQLSHVLREQFVSTFLWGIPLTTWFQPVCAVSDLPYMNLAHSSSYTTSATLSCSLIQGSWGAGYVLLLGVALALAGGACWKLWQQRRTQEQDWTPEKQQQAVRQFARLMLLAADVLVIFLYLHSPLSGLKPWSTRYLVGMLVATPAILWPLWRLTGLEKTHLTFRGATRWLSRVALVLIALVALGMTVWTTTTVPAAYADDQQQMQLVSDLTKMHITRVYLEYWTCYRLAFQSQEQIICAAPPYPATVGGTPYQAYGVALQNTQNAPFMFPADNTDEINAFKAYNQAHGKHFREILLDGMALFIPEQSG